MKPSPVSDLLSNHNDQLANAAKLLGKSNVRIKIFEAVYCGKKETKTIYEISKSTGLTQVHVLKEGGKLAGLLFEKVPNAYKKMKQFSPRYKQIVSLAKNPQKLKNLPTKISPSNHQNSISIKFPRIANNAIHITVNDIDSFSKIIKLKKTTDVRSMREEEIKELFKNIIGEKGSFKDWGGEKSDLFTTRLNYKFKRLRCAIAFKGRGTEGKLVPKKMGKNGDQIGRLFEEPADIYLIIYNGQIDSSIISQMQAYAIAKALGGQKIYYGTADDQDLGLIAGAYIK